LKLLKVKIDIKQRKNYSGETKLLLTIGRWSEFWRLFLAFANFTFQLVEEKLLESKMSCRRSSQCNAEAAGFGKKLWRIKRSVTSRSTSRSIQIINKELIKLAAGTIESGKDAADPGLLDWMNKVVNGDGQSLRQFLW
jgi:hypothetical protein